MDVLRIFAVFSMMLLHVAGSLWSKTDVATADWQAFNIYDSFARFCVPVFIMLSGAMFLDNSREFSMKRVRHRYFVLLDLREPVKLLLPAPLQER